jgi:uncharacterized membrane protein
MGNAQISKLIFAHYSFVFNTLAQYKAKLQLDSLQGATTAVPTPVATVVADQPSVQTEEEEEEDQPVAA